MSTKCSAGLQAFPCKEKYIGDPIYHQKLMEPGKRCYEISYFVIRGL